MIKIGKIFWFSASHQLPHHEGECANLHGHNYKLEVEIAREEYSAPLQCSGPAQGMVMDFGDLDLIIEDSVMRLCDHTNLNDTYDNPTAEIMVKDMSMILGSCLPLGVKLVSLKRWETEKCYAEWTND